MSKKEQKTTGKAIREAERNKGQVRLKCVYPPCSNQVVVPAPPEGIVVGSVGHIQKLGKIPLCPMHMELLQFYMWCQISVKVEAQRTPGGLVLPGHEKYTAPMPSKENVLAMRRPVGGKQ
uniref:Uncharacterized protein n=1 Tax=viral metagenome TaxID=1070528 RepID=A0A6H1ZUR3_9ZZZZ